jgi:hypothetical protein
VNLFSRESLIDALRELVTELQTRGRPIGLRIVGGSALALRYFDRDSTTDIDALHVSPGTDDEVSDAVRAISLRRGWPDDWFNFAVTNTPAEPRLGKPVAWELLYDRGGVMVEVASAEALLVMKLQANRPGRDTEDIRKLLALCEIASVETAEHLFEEYYPGDTLSDRALNMVTNILADGPLIKPQHPGPIEI